MKVGLALVLIALALSLLTQASAQNTPALTHARAVVNIKQNQPYFVGLKWAVPFKDDKYTVSCSPIASPGLQGAGNGVYLFQVTRVAPASIQVEVAAIGTGLMHIDCLGLHD